MIFLVINLDPEGKGDCISLEEAIERASPVRMDLTMFIGNCY